jgi:ABC-type spermidine/putrescine transport system permease subunit II
VIAACRPARRRFRSKAALTGLFVLPMLALPLVYGIPLGTVLPRHLGGALPGAVLIDVVPILPFVILVLAPFLSYSGSRRRTRWTLNRAYWSCSRSAARRR